MNEIIVLLKFSSLIRFYTPTGINTILSSGQIPLKFDAHGAIIKKGKPKEVIMFTRNIIYIKILIFLIKTLQVSGNKWCYMYIRGSTKSWLCGN